MSSSNAIQKQQQEGWQSDAGHQRSPYQPPARSAPNGVVVTPASPLNGNVIDFTLSPRASMHARQPHHYAAPQQYPSTQQLNDLQDFNALQQYNYVQQHTNPYISDSLGQSPVQPPNFNPQETYPPQQQRNNVRVFNQPEQGGGNVNLGSSDIHNYMARGSGFQYPMMGYRDQSPQINMGYGSPFGQQIYSQQRSSPQQRVDISHAQYMAHHQDHQSSAQQSLIKPHGMMARQSPMTQRNSRQAQAHGKMPTTPRRISQQVQPPPISPLTISRHLQNRNLHDQSQRARQSIRATMQKSGHAGFQQRAQTPLRQHPSPESQRTMTPAQHQLYHQKAQEIARKHLMHMARQREQGLQIPAQQQHHHRPHKMGSGSSTQPHCPQRHPDLSRTAMQMLAQQHQQLPSQTSVQMPAQEYRHVSSPSFTNLSVHQQQRVMSQSPAQIATRSREQTPSQLDTLAITQSEVRLHQPETTHTSVTEPAAVSVQDLGLVAPQVANIEAHVELQTPDHRMQQDKEVSTCHVPGLQMRICQIPASDDATTTRQTVDQIQVPAQETNTGQNPFSNNAAVAQQSADQDQVLLPQTNVSQNPHTNDVAIAQQIASQEHVLALQTYIGQNLPASNAVTMQQAVCQGQLPSPALRSASSTVNPRNTGRAAAMRMTPEIIRAIIGLFYPRPGIYSFLLKGLPLWNQLEETERQAFGDPLTYAVLLTAFRGDCQSKITELTAQVRNAEQQPERNRETALIPWIECLVEGLGRLLVQVEASVGQPPPVASNGACVSSLAAVTANTNSVGGSAAQPVIIDDSVEEQNVVPAPSAHAPSGYAPASGRSAPVTKARTDKQPAKKTARKPRQLKQPKIQQSGGGKDGSQSSKRRRSEIMDEDAPKDKKSRSSSHVITTRLPLQPQSGAVTSETLVHLPPKGQNPAVTPFNPYTNFNPYAQNPVGIPLGPRADFYPYAQAQESAASRAYAPHSLYNPPIEEPSRQKRKYEASSGEEAQENKRQKLVFTAGGDEEMTVATKQGRFTGRAWEFHLLAPIAESLGTPFITVV